MVDKKNYFLCLSDKRDIELIYLALNRTLYNFQCPLSDSSNKRIKFIVERIEDLLYE